MVTSLQKLPPSGQGFEAYRLVKINGVSTRHAAATLGLSQTRVCQLVKAVGLFLGETVPSNAGEESKQQREQRVAVAEHVAACRVDHLYGMALEAFEASKGPQISTREVKGGRAAGALVQVERTSVGDWRYLMAACRLAKHASDLPSSTLEYGWDAQELLDEEDDSLHQDAFAPPVGDCSPIVSAEANEEVVRTERRSVSLFTEDRCDEEVTLEELLANRAQRPVQLDFDPHAGEEAEESRLPLSRSERRARKRLLERKLRKAK